MVCTLRVTSVTYCVRRPGRADSVLMLSGVMSYKVPANNAEKEVVPFDLSSLFLPFLFFFFLLGGVRRCFLVLKRMLIVLYDRR